jgi:hypothetical protein
MENKIIFKEEVETKNRSLNEELVLAMNDALEDVKKGEFKIL